MIKKLLLCISMGLVLSSCLKKEREKFDLQGSQSLSEHDLWTLAFKDSSTLFAGGGTRFEQGVLFKSADAGKTWEEISIDFDHIITGITFKNDTGVFVTSGGSYCLSSDGGNHWSDPIFTGNVYFYTVEALPKGGFLIGGGIGYQRGSLFRLNSRLKRTRHDSFSFEIRKIFILSDKNVYLSGYGRVMESRDGGYNWSRTRADGDFFVAMDGNERGLKVGGKNGLILSRVPLDNEKWVREKNQTLRLTSGGKINFISFNHSDTWVAGGEDIFLSEGKGNWIKLKEYNDSEMLDGKFNPYGSELFLCGQKGMVLILKE